MNTKEKILKSALKLFNQQGYSRITTRHIASNIGISVGNLHYHFKQSNDIVKTLFEELITKSNVHITELENNSSKDLEKLQNLFDSMFDLFYEYRFFFHYFVQICTENHEIKLKYNELRIRRQVELLKIFNDLKDEKILRNNIPDFVLKSLINQIFIIGDCWLGYNVVTNNFTEQQSKQEFSKIIFSLFYPLLTEASQIIYLKK